MDKNDIDINKITESIIGAAIEVHRHLGPGLLEAAYEECLCRELSLRAVSFKRQVPLPIIYKGIPLDCSYRLDLLVDERVVVEIKAIEVLLPIHDAQLLTYLKLGGWKIGLLINFNVPLLKDGIHRLANGLEEFTPIKQSIHPIIIPPKKTL
jgi:GxxExxY protein